MQTSKPDKGRVKTEKPIDFDDYSSEYDALLRDSTKQYTDDIDFFSRYKVDLARKNVCNPVKRVLEYGCGTGRNISHLTAAFPGTEIVGTDVSAASLNTAAKANPTAHFEIERNDLDIGTFDLIFVAGVFHHIPPEQREHAMSLLSRRMAHGAQLFIFEHNPNNPVTQRIVNTCPFDDDAILLKPGELVALFESAGIHFVKKSFCLFVPPKLSWLNPIERLLTWLPLGGQYWVQGRST